MYKHEEKLTETISLEGKLEAISKDVMELRDESRVFFIDYKTGAVSKQFNKDLDFAIALLEGIKKELEAGTPIGRSISALDLF